MSARQQRTGRAASEGSIGCFSGRALPSMLRRTLQLPLLTLWTRQMETPADMNSYAQETIRFIEEVERVAAAPMCLISTRFNFRSIIDRRTWRM
jgi:hypothetical protein